MRALKLLFVIEHFLPVIGGLENSTHRLATHLTQLGHQVTLLTTTQTTSEEDSSISYRVIRQPPLSTCFVHAALASISSSFDASLIFGVGHDPLLCHWRTLLSAKMPPAYLKVGSDGDLQRDYINESLLRRFAGIFCQTSTIESEAKALGVMPDRIFAISNGMDINRWKSSLPDKSAARAKLGIPLNAFVVIVVARLVRRKRVDLAIKSWERLASSCDFAWLLIHGSDFKQDDGCEDEIIKQSNASPHARRILRLLPNLSNAMSFAAADVLLSMSERDGAPNIFVEALATGLPLVATDLPGHRRYIVDTNNGFIVPHCDEITAGLRLTELAKSPNIQKDFAAASAARANLFDIRTTATGYLKVLTRHRSQTTTT